MTLSSRRPYLIRAMYDWVVDNGLTPYLLVSADAQGVTVPEGYAQEGRLTLNVNPQAVQGLQLGNDLISFSARFGGRPFQVSLPPGAVLAIYARENGEGMLFGEEETPEPPPEGGPPENTPKSGRAHLKVIK
jgi:stringent starvation protein B